MYHAKQDRYQSMEYRRCDRSGLKLPAISLGLWHNFGMTGDFENMTAMCTTAFDNGITHFDLANNYGPMPGAAETNFGRIMRETLHAYRDEIVISTKAGYDMWPGPYGSWGSRKHLLSSLDQSLKRMGLEYVDIFYHHRPDPETPIEESMLALAQAVHSGKALYVGLSRYDPNQLRQAWSILHELKCPFVIVQDRYNIFDRSAVERTGSSVLDQHYTWSAGRIVFSPLAQGLLTDRYLSGIPADSRIKTDGRFLQKSALTPERLEQIRALDRLAHDRGQTLAQMALAWLLHRNHDGNRFVTSVLIGASRPEQITENLKAIENYRFTTSELIQIDRICGLDYSYDHYTRIRND